MKVKRKFTYEGVELRVVEREEPYMNAKEPLLMTRVLAPNNKHLPITIHRRQTIKSIIEESLRFLDEMKQKGHDVVKELTEED